MTRDLKSFIGPLLDSSEFLAAAAALRAQPPASRLFGRSTRPLSAKEVSQLEARGNSCAGWQKIRAARGFDPCAVSHSIFSGACVIGAFSRRKIKVDAGLVLPCGIYRSTIIDSEIGNESLVCNSVVLRCVIAAGAAVFSVGELACSGTTAFGNGTVVPVGIETGGRDIPVYAELTVPVAREVALRRGDRSFLGEYARFVKQNTRGCSLPFGVVGAGCIVRCSARIVNAFLEPGCIISGAALVENATILCSAPGETRVEDGAIVRNSCLQWGCTVSSMAIVENSVLAEHSSAEKHAKVTNSIIGPNTQIAQGEVTASLVGPFVGLHHQSMLIGVLWPQGKGNVASGANVGSNHTSRAPDQELWCGEGMFLGLGVNVKYPADFSRAPYTVIATGVTTPPQKLEFPFSLINIPAHRPEGARPSQNELFPGWVLSDNLYMVLRNEAKFEKRNRATRSLFSFETFTPGIIDLLITSRDRLALVTETRPWYDESHIPGAGQNFITEQNRRKGIDTYNFFIEYYCLRGLVSRLARSPHAALVYRRRTADAVWEHQRAVMAKEGFASRSVRENCLRLIDMLDTISRNALASKEKDDARGRRIIDDYDTAHVAALRDAFVNETALRTVRMKAATRKILVRL
jgi:hypothetical protein